MPHRPAILFATLLSTRCGTALPRRSSHRLAILFATLLSTAAPAPGQEPTTEIEFGGGWHQWNPLGIEDIVVYPSGPSVNFAWTTWLSERRGVAAGITAVLWRVDPREHNDVAERAFPVYAYAAHRWRWRRSDRDTVHFGVGGGWLAWSETTRVLRWYPEIPAWGYSGETEGSVQGSPWFHAEVFLTRRVRDGLAVRLGVTFTPLLYVPMTGQPLVMSVWQF